MKVITTRQYAFNAFVSVWYYNQSWPWASVFSQTAIAIARSQECSCWRCPIAGTVYDRVIVSGPSHRQRHSAMRGIWQLYESSFRGVISPAIVSHNDALTKHGTVMGKTHRIQPGPKVQLEFALPSAPVQNLPPPMVPTPRAVHGPIRPPVSAQPATVVRQTTPDPPAQFVQTPPPYARAVKSKRRPLPLTDEEMRALCREKFKAMMASSLHSDLLQSERRKIFRREAFAPLVELRAARAC